METYLKDTVVQVLLKLGLDTNSIENDAEVVRDDTVTGPLGEEGKSNDDPHSLEVTPLGEHCLVRARVGGFLFDSEGFLDLFVLESDQGVVMIVAAVVFGENGDGFLITAVVDEPSGRLDAERYG